MNRHYTAGEYFRSVEYLRGEFENPAITTDVIVGFPGETEEEFEQSLAFIRKCAFADMHIFPYSRRPSTPADKMTGQHSNAVKEQRSRKAIAVATEMSQAYRENLVNTTVSVLFEEKDGVYYTGHTPNYVKVYVQGEELHNKVCQVIVTQLYADGVLGRLDNPAAM